MSAYMTKIGEHTKASRRTITFWLMTKNELYRLICVVRNCNSFNLKTKQFITRPRLQTKMV